MALFDSNLYLNYRANSKGNLYMKQIKGKSRDIYPGYFVNTQFYPFY